MTSYRHATVNDQKIFYREAGPKASPAILLLHGFPTSSHMFRNLIPALADRYHAVAPDLPGFGFSEAPDRKRYRYTFENLAKTIDSFTRAIGLDQYAIYVFDYGAPVGFRLALAHPERITAVISQNGNAYEEGLSQGWNPIQKYWKEPTAENRAALREFLTPTATKSQYLYGVKDETLVAPEAYTLDSALLAGSGNDEIQLDLFLDYASNVALYPKFQEYFRTKRPPLLAVWGKDDPFFLPPGAEAFKRDNPAAEVHFYDTGHFALETHAQEIAGATREFLSRKLTVQANAAWQSLAPRPESTCTAGVAATICKGSVHGGENVTDSAKLTNDVVLEGSLSEGTVSLESILCTEELRRRPRRPPDHEKENSALVALASALAESRHTILQTLAETILHVTESDSAGVSLLTTDDGEKRFYWAAIAGIWKPHVGGGTPRNFGPCGDVLDRNRTLLFRHFERRYPYLVPVMPAVEECLLVPFYVDGKAVGTIWAIMHSDRRKFDAEDERLMKVLGQFAALAYQTLASIEDLKTQMAAREKAETELRDLTDALEMQVRGRTEELEQRNRELAEARARLAEEKLYLEQSEAYLVEAQRLSHTGSWYWNARTGKVIWSQEFFAIFGFDPEKTKPSYPLYLERIHPEDRSKVEEVRMALFAFSGLRRSRLQKLAVRGRLREKNG